MRSSGLHFLPLVLPLFLAFVLLVGLLILLIEINLLGYAYEKVGIHHRYIITLLLLSLMGSYVNIPIAELPTQHLLSGGEVTHFGMRYVIPLVEDWPRTVVAINVGGALIPTLLSLYLLIHNELYGPGLVAVAIVATIVHRMAQPVAGIGIVVPMFLPSIIAAVLAFILSRQHAPALAYMAGSLGTLIGGDLLNLGKLQGFGAPVVSIGGAGTFDGIFLAGILAVLLA
jgi:uncharacterized membrane protein